MGVSASTPLTADMDRATILAATKPYESIEEENHDLETQLAAATKRINDTTNTERDIQLMEVVRNRNSTRNRLFLSTMARVGLRGPGVSTDDTQRLQEQATFLDAEIMKLEQELRDYDTGLMNVDKTHLRALERAVALEAQLAEATEQVDQLDDSSVECA